ncbi:Mannan endo-1,4-beta-mannosidase [Armadillidium vulgare]|nr:Mannan endo-1,4-beta-mannosidase [Armadillidium vulgare]
MFKYLLNCLLLLGVVSSSLGARLATSGTTLTYNGEQVYLNGVNIAWNNYGYDFGNGQYDGTLDEWLNDIGTAGGNAVRIWVHVEGYSSPAFGSDGTVTGCDSTGTFIDDVTRFLNTAQENNILVIFTLWNGAYVTNQNEVQLFLDDTKLESYIDNCFQEFASSVAGHPALGAWESINEPEGSVLVTSDSDPCYDTSLLEGSGAGWTVILHFIGRINQAAHEFDPTGLVTDPWILERIFQLSQLLQTPTPHSLHTQSTHATPAALARRLNLTFYNCHTYDWNGQWSENDPFTVKASDYQLDKPLLIGEYSSACAAGTSLTDLIEYGYSNGYVGTLDWHWAATGGCSDTRDAQRSSLSYLSGRTENGVVDFTVA